MIKDGKFYDSLPINFEGKGDVRGSIFQQLKNGKRCYVYSKEWKGVTSYEVFVKRVQKEGVRIIEGREVHFKAMELYPSSSEFGETAWYFPTLEKAIQKFEQQDGIQSKHKTNI